MQVPAHRAGRLWLRSAVATRPVCEECGLELTQSRTQYRLHVTKAHRMTSRRAEHNSRHNNRPAGDPASPFQGLTERAQKGRLLGKGRRAALKRLTFNIQRSTKWPHRAESHWTLKVGR